MRFRRLFRCVVLLFVITAALHRVPAQAAPSIKETSDWIAGRLTNWGTSWPDGDGVSIKDYSSAEFPADGGYTSGGTAGCMLVLRDRYRFRSRSDARTNQTEASEFHIYFNLMKYPVHTGQNQALGGVYFVSLVPAVPPDASNGPFAVWRDGKGTQGGISIYQTNQEDINRMVNAFNNLIRLCGGSVEKPEPF
jgi:hypothetical protein